MPQAHARFVRTYNVNVHYSIQPETNQDGLYHITIAHALPVHCKASRPVASSNTATSS